MVLSGGSNLLYGGAVRICTINTQVNSIFKMIKMKLDITDCVPSHRM